MRKIYFAIIGIVALMSYSDLKAQTLNDPANWPNTGWTVGGSYVATALLNDPTVDANFTFDDDAAGSGSVDALSVESPIIDLTAAHTNGEFYIYIDFAYVHRQLGSSVLNLEYWDADLANWVLVEELIGNSTTFDYQSCSSMSSFTPMIDITSFTTNQLTGFKYRFNYDDGGGWVYGFCISSPTITSTSCVAPSLLTLVNTSSNSADVSWTAGASETSWNISWGTPGYTPGDANELGTDVSPTTSATISGLTAETSYDVYVQADCGGDGTSNWVGPLNVFTGYCTPAPSSVDGDGITNVTIGTLSNTTGLETNNYGDYSSLIETVVRTQTVNFSVTNSSAYDMWVLIDWNNDLDFDDTDEQYYMGSYNGTDDIDILIPATASLGNHRVRIGGSDFSTTTPYQPSYACYTGSWGSFEDYTINVITEPIAPSITQDPATPDCVNGSEISTTGTPGTDEMWYWQTTATGTSTANDATTPWVVMDNGSYYVRTLNTLYNVWSTADSIIITNFPVATTPSTPIAAANPACLSTTISMPAATSPDVYYWQGTDNTSYDMTMDAATPYDVTATGTYYVKTYNSTTQCWSEAVGVMVTIDTIIPNAPASTPPIITCSGSTSIMMTANPSGMPLTYTLHEMDSFGDGWNGNTIDVLVDGVVVLDDVTLLDGFDGTETFTVIEGATVTTVWNGGGSFSGEVSYEILDQNSVVVGTGNDNTQINYAVPMGSYSFNWYDAPSAGTLLGSGNPFEAVGTSVMPTANTGSYNFYASQSLGACESDSTTMITVDVYDVNVELLAVDASCNNGIDGSFALVNTICGTTPFTYSVDGGTFGTIPNDLSVGNHTVVVKDANDNLSAVYNITINGPAAPSDLAITSFSNDTATVVWLENGSATSWNVEWGLAGYTPGTGNEVGSAVANDTFYTITGLDGGMLYDIYITTNCGGLVADSSTISVNTDCDPVDAFSFCESFEDIAALSCWRVIDGNGDSDVWGVSTDPTYANNGSNALVINTDFNFGDNNDYVVLPKVTLSGNEVMSFSYRVRNDTEPNDFEILLSTTGYDTTHFNTVLFQDTASNETYVDTSINLSAYTGDVFIAFHIPEGGLDGWMLFIDDVCFKLCTPAAGTDGTNDFCRTDSLLNLNSVITSPYPMTIGSWEFQANQGIIQDSIMNLSTIASGTYHVNYIIEGGCTNDTTVATINVYAPSSAGTNGLLTACKNQPIDLYGGLSGTVDFGGTWYDASGTALTSSYFTTGTLQGQFVYKYIVTNGPCGPDTAEVIVNIQTCDYAGVENVDKLKDITLAPNPNNGLFVIAGIPGEGYSYEVVDLSGRTVLNKTEINATSVNVNLTNVEHGVYLVRITGNDSEKMIRVIKN